MLARKILLVDDSKSARFALKKLLQQHDLEVEMVDSGEAALDFLEQERPDVIFMDHLMKGMDGLAATQRIKQNPQTADIPVVMCTSNDGEDYVQKARSQGAIGTLLKPPSPSKLDAILETADQAIRAARPTATTTAGKPGDATPAVATVSPPAAPELDLESVWEQLRPRIAALVSNELLQFEKALNANMQQQREKFQALLDSAQRQQDALIAGAGENLARAGREVEQGRREAERLIADRLEEQNRNFWQQLNELKEKVGGELVASEQVTAEIGRAAREAARSTASETAAEVACKIAPVSAEEALLPQIDEKLGRLEGKLEQLQQVTSRKAGLYAVAAALAGIVAAVVVYLV
ncbi:MAG TPA: response regulator [Sedimenticola sp.]|nr:response regulator [Sedimenticola sp.]